GDRRERHRRAASVRPDRELASGDRPSLPHQPGPRAARVADEATVCVDSAQDLPAPPAQSLTRTHPGELLGGLVPGDDRQIVPKGEDGVPRANIWLHALTFVAAPTPRRRRPP